LNVAHAATTTAPAAATTAAFTAATTAAFTAATTSAFTAFTAFTAATTAAFTTATTTAFTTAISLSGRFLSQLKLRPKTTTQTPGTGPEESKNKEIPRSHGDQVSKAYSVHGGLLCG
jgi:hypothetical protein